MNRTVKTILVWLLMLLLPLHAVAASVGMSCAPVSQHQATAPIAAVHQSATDAHADHGQHMDHGAQPASEQHASAPDVVKKPHTSCSACSALCAGAVAPPSAFLSLPTFDGSEAVVVSPSDFIAGFIPEGPQRPPRHRFA